MCSKSPKRGEVDKVIRFASQRPAGLDNGHVIEQPIVFRTNANSRSLLQTDT